MADLEPCPFCGSGAKLYGGPMAQEMYSVWCSNPNGKRHHLDGLGYCEETAIAAWNTRAKPAPDLAAALIEAEKALLDTLASLVAAISLLEKGGKAAKRAAPSDKMFDQMLLDYKASANRVRATLDRIRKITGGE